MAHDKNNIVFYAPIGSSIKGFKRGGAEAGCKKTMEVLQKANYNVVHVEKPIRKSESRLDGFLFIFTLIRVWFKLTSIIIKDRNCVLHIAGFYLNQVYYENLLVVTASILRVKTVYEIRNGGMIESYVEGNRLYRIFLKSILLNATSVLCQGYEYVVFLKEKLGRESTYYPNYIMDNYISKNNLDRATYDNIKLVYFGRVVPDKNIEFIIEVCSKLQKFNLPFTLEIIGGYEDHYYQQLQEKIVNEGLPNEIITFYGRLEFKQIYTKLTTSHFFIFPSKEKREGHSNSLTEAMGCGVIPIVSQAGFNESIVGKPSLVVDTFNPDIYAAKILDIWKSGEWINLSNYVYTRVVSNFTESIVKKSLIGMYKTIFL